MIYDCFSFFNELELLEIRLHELSDVVDKFVLVEATRTHTGWLKPLHFSNHMYLFTDFLDQIIHVVVEDMPITEEQIDASISGKDKKWIESKYQVEDHWVRERFQRNAMMQALQDCDPEDIIIISDADEIVRKSVVENIENMICEGSNAVEQYLNSYYLNLICTNMPWWGSKIIKRKYLNDQTPSEVRFHTPASCYIEDGGWHYAWLGGADKILEKIESYAHQEFNVPEVADINTIKRRLENHVDVLGRLYEYEVIELNEQNSPSYVLNNLDKFKDWIW